MTIKVNGKDEAIETGTTVEALLKNKGIGEKGVAVARNNKLVTKSEWNKVTLEEGDELVVINAAYGG